MINQHDPIFFTPPSGPSRNRRLYKGGGGDGGASARKAAEEARVASALAKINDAFGIYTDQAPQQMQGRFGELMTAFQPSEAGTQARRDKAAQTMAGRESLYSTIGQDSTNSALYNLNKDRDLVERDAGFSLARQGLSGGSRDIDLNRDILDTHQQGVLKASDMGLSVANNARSADDRTRVGLINSVRAGLDEGSAQQQAYEAMSGNARQARDDAKSSSLAGFFDTLRSNQKQYSFNQGVADATKKYGNKSSGDGSKIINAGGNP